MPAAISAWGTTDTAEARRLVDVCLDSGVTMFDTAAVSVPVTSSSCATTSALPGGR